MPSARKKKAWRGTERGTQGFGRQTFRQAEVQKRALGWGAARRVIAAVDWSI
jgi:hypothetical protein